MAVRHAPADEAVPMRLGAGRFDFQGIHVRRDTSCLQPLSAMTCWRCRGRGKSSTCDNTVSKRSGNPRLKNREAGVVPSAARQSKLVAGAKFAIAEIFST